MERVKKYEVVGIFISIEELDKSVNELFIHGFDQSSLSVLANEDSVKNKLKKDYKKVDDIADNEDTPRAAFYAEENFGIIRGLVLGTMMFIGITIAAYIFFSERGSFLFASFIAGKIIVIGILLAKIIGKYHQKYIDQQLKKGGLLLWVRLRDKSLKDIVIRTLKNNHARNVHLRYMPTDLNKLK